MRKKSGFTLLELMTVIGIMAVLATIAIPNFLGWLPKYKLGSAARDILSAMQYARLVAVKENVDVRVNFDTDNNNFLIFPDFNNNDNQDPDEPTIKSGNMPGGVYLTETNFSSDSFNFDSRGLASGSGGTISIANNRNKLTRIRINRTGNSRILREDE
jgi:type IV fimbrial biogenesis protein FimT